MLTVDDEDVCRAGGDAGYVDEVDVVIRQRHRRLVTRPIRRRAHVIPGQRVALRSRQHIHIDEPHLSAVRNEVEHVRVMVEDGAVRLRQVEAGGRGGLGGPLVARGIVDVDIVRRGLVGIEEVDGVEELGEVAGGVGPVEGWSAGGGGEVFRWCA